MAVRMSKDWSEFNAANVERLTCHLGVYQLGTSDGEIVYIGVADGRSKFGLKGELLDQLDRHGADVDRFRVEVNMAYRTRHLELLEAYVHDRGGLPSANTDVDIASLGKLSPAGG